MRLRILVADDDATVRNILQHVLCREYEVVAASNGYEALTQTLREGRGFDLIITDLSMPYLNGVEFVENLIEHIPVVVISSFVNLPEFQGAVARLHPAAVLEKPFHIEELCQTVQRVLGG